jgi:alpha-D-ribose 1-methylphosphonate 5-triphosphate synthase subunit PhnG
MTISFHKVAGDSHLHLHFGHLVDALIQSDDKYNKTKIDHVDYDPIIKPN